MSDHDKAHIDHTVDVLLAQLANVPTEGIPREQEQHRILRDALQYAYACGCMVSCP
jgi:hypothetical protein